MFHENWYVNSQIRSLRSTYSKVKSLRGLILEIGCWEGKSTIAIANACYPEPLHAIDHWQGNLGEGVDHPTVLILESRDVYGTFMENIEEKTRQNVVVHKADCFEYLANLKVPVKFCHIDASHNYEDVKRTLEMLVPHVIENGILCGDDFLSAGLNHPTLNGGVERAVRELLPNFKSKYNFWFWKKKRQPTGLRRLLMSVLFPKGTKEKAP